MLEFSKKAKHKGEMKRERAVQKEYASYAKHMGGRHDTDTYYQYLEKTGKLKASPSSQYGTSMVGKIRQAGEDRDKSLEEALDEKELKRMGYKRK